MIKDHVRDKQIHFDRDSLDRVRYAYETTGEGIQAPALYIEYFTHDNFGNVTNREVSVGQASHNYTYTYKDNSTRELESVRVNGITYKPQTDVLGRNKGKEIYYNNVKVAEENIVYRKVGDHATNMPASVYFGDKDSGRYAIKDNVKYAYDTMGNIEKVYQNGELVARYAYDKLNRIIREDNKAFGKTWLYTYDTCGNILNKRETEFTLKTNVEECVF